MSRRIIFKIGGLAAVLVFIVVSVSFTSMERKDIVCSNMQVLFREPYRFVTSREIETIVNKNFKGFNGALVDTVNSEMIEEKIEENPWVKNAEVFKGYAASDSTGLWGGMKIYIEQEIPVLRIVQGADGYYVNSNGKHLPVSSSNTMSVTVYTGNINDKTIQEQLLPFEQFIDHDPFLKALIQQVDVRENNELVLVPRVGDHLIEFGKPENITQKFRNLKAAYKNGFDPEAWKQYKTVSLKYKNQVVCTLK